MPKVSKSSNTEQKRVYTWEKNDIEIRNAKLKFLQENGRMPSHKELTAMTSLSYQTIRKHQKEMDFTELTKEFKSLTKDVVVSIFKSSLKGNTASQKLWLQVVEGWAEKREVSVNDVSLADIINEFDD